MRWVKATIVIFVVTVASMAAMLPLAHTSWAESLRSGFIGRGQRERIAQGLPAEHDVHEEAEGEMHARGQGEHTDAPIDPLRAAFDIGGVLVKMAIAGGITVAVVAVAKAATRRARPA